MATHRLHTEIVAYLPSLRRYALTLTRDRDTAEDLVQEALARAIKGAATWDPSRNLRVWLFGILHNAWVDQNRRRGVEQEASAALRAEQPRYTAPDQGDRVLLGQTMAALFRLPADQREVLLLTAMDGLSYREAAEIVGIPVGTLMSRLARARQALRAATDWADEPAAQSVAARKDHARGPLYLRLVGKRS